jgi:hypothetical protein
MVEITFEDGGEIYEMKGLENFRRIMRRKAKILQRKEIKPATKPKT